jgi:hypothetical protein
MSCNQEQKKLYESLMASPSNKLESNLELDYSFIANYLSEYVEESDLKRILARSLYVFNPQGGIHQDKLKNILESFEIKKDVLFNNGYVNSEGITTKGELIKLLNGYEQIPIINILTNKTLEGLSPIQIAGIIGGLANIEYNTKSDIPRREKESIKQNDAEYLRALQKTQKQVKGYEISVSKLNPDKEIELSTKVMDHLYTWAELNSLEEDSRKSWKTMYEDENLSIKDEGSLFKEITMTTDLLKQLIDVANYGRDLSQTAEDKAYYSNLSSKFKQALELIQREPAEG